MRKLMRSVARARMIDAGYTRINKKNAAGRSFFSRKWREFIPKAR